MCVQAPNPTCCEEPLLHWIDTFPNLKQPLSVEQYKPYMHVPMNPVLVREHQRLNMHDCSVFLCNGEDIYI